MHKSNRERSCWNSFSLLIIWGINVDRKTFSLGHRLINSVSLELQGWHHFRSVASSSEQCFVWYQILYVWSHLLSFYLCNKDCHVLGIHLVKIILHISFLFMDFISLCKSYPCLFNTFVSFGKFQSSFGTRILNASFIYSRKMDFSNSFNLYFRNMFNYLTYLLHHIFVIDGRKV